MIASADTLSRPKNGSCRVTKSAGCILAMSWALSVLRLSVTAILSASFLSQTLIVRTPAVGAGVSGITTVGRGRMTSATSGSGSMMLFPGRSPY